MPVRVSSCRRAPLAALVACVVSAVALLAGPASPAAAGGPRHLVVEGPFSAGGEITSDAPCAPDFRTVLDGGGEWTAVGEARVHLDHCVHLEPDTRVWPVTGTFEIVTADGTLTGGVGGELILGDPPPGTSLVPITVRLVLTVDGGTGRFERATGTLVIEGTDTSQELFVSRPVGTVSGAIDLPAPTPLDPRDCRRGGWRHLADDEGRPFRNQRQCVAWARAHRAPGAPVPDAG